jgi:HAD superfamily hydrolase (TIGR01509 family)
MMGTTSAPPGAILFDVDGTLIDTYRLYLEAYRRALRPYLGYAPPDEEFIARRPSSERRFLADWIGSENAAACHAAMCRHYEELHGALCEGIYDGVREMLGSLRSAGIPIGVVTGKGRDAWLVTQAELGLGDFGVVVTDDDVTEPKPHPDGLLGAAAALAVAPPEVVYVGDSPADLEAGRRAGMRVGAALWPKTAPGEREAFLAMVRDHRPDWAFDRPAEVTQVFARWC